MAAAGENATKPAEPPAAIAETTDAQLEYFCRMIATQLRVGKVIPFLGAGANVCGRPPLPPGTPWEPGAAYLPTGQELADYLLREEPYPPDESRDLVRVAQFLDLTYEGEGPLFDKLRALFEPLYEPTELHNFLVGLPAKLKAEGCETPYQLIVTTNYDDVLERAFREAEVPFSVIYYRAERERRGRFVELQPDGRAESARRASAAPTLSLQERSVILKIHGAFNRLFPPGDSYVITEDHYIDYLAGANVARLLPDYVIARMLTSHVLFLGYGMRDWNLRVILRHIWSEQERRFGSWAIQHDPPDLDVRFWQRHRVRIENVPLERWLAAMLAELP